MPPPVALVLTLLFIAYLFQREFRRQYKPSAALWIPCVWLLIVSSRAVSEWLNLGQPIQQGYVLEDGSPTDRAAFFLLIIAGLIVLLKRRISWSEIFQNNIALTLFFVYCGISIFWSDYPFVTFKRWTKAFGDPIMALIILTEPEPIKAIERIIKICAYVHIPLSVLFIKYYPTLGKAYDDWTGVAFYTGVATSKNMLGFFLMICGLVLVWSMSVQWARESKSKMWIDDFGIPIFLLCMIGWLFMMADSKTSLIGFILGVLVYIALGRQNVRRHIGGYLLAALLMVVALEASVDLTKILITSAGRDSTLSGRTELWGVLLNMDPKPIFGHGFESFWLGDRYRRLQAMWWYGPTMAHNGYIEMYLNLGWVGLLFLTGIIVSSYVKLRKTLTSSSDMTDMVMFGRFGMAFLAAYIPYNYTEAAFRSLHFLFLIFLVLTIKPPERQKQHAHSSPFVLSKGAQRVPRTASIGNMSSAR